MTSPSTTPAEPAAHTTPVEARPPLVATIVVILAIIEGRLQVLLIHRTAEPERGKWALPGGRWDGSESLGQRAQRKLVEETGATDVYLEQLFTRSGLDHAQPSVAVAYFALVEASTVRLREEQEWPPAWHAVADLPQLAFENNRVIEQAVARVGAKLDYTNIAYGLLPELFTLRELQATYEAILSRPLDRRNFRKRMLSAGIVEAVPGETRRHGAHRPAQLYRFTSKEPVVL
ncbi:MAG: NUDIX hydrolase [Dehalococcoidia bacterium]|nr:NUDIX hydrolase [Dehalococcoidia bacterium]